MSSTLNPAHAACTKPFLDAIVGNGLADGDHDTVSSLVAKERTSDAVMVGQGGAPSQRQGDVGRGAVWLIVAAVYD